MRQSNRLIVLSRFISNPKKFAGEWRQTRQDLANSQKKLAQAKEDLANIERQFAQTEQELLQPDPAEVPKLSTPIPSGDLLYLVSGHRNAEIWAASRQSAVHDVIVPRLRECGFRIQQRRAILDFGCGCGRILAGWEGSLGAAELYGVDVNPALIDFCQHNIGFAKTTVCGAFPPLVLPNSGFDLVYAASVWTHMTLPQAVQWAGEMARVIATGGALMMSYHGDYYVHELASFAPEGCQSLAERGYYVHKHLPPDQTFLGSNDYATYMTSEFVRSLFKGFQLLRIYPGACGPNSFAANQDVAIFRRMSD